MPNLLLKVQSWTEYQYMEAFSSIYFAISAIFKPIQLTQQSNNIANIKKI